MGVILLVIGFGLLLVGVSFLFAWKESDWCGLDFENTGSIIFNVLSVFVFVVVLIMSICAIIINCYKDSKIYSREQQRIYLVETYNAYRNDYEKDIIHYETLKEVSKEIANFNTMIYKEDLYNNSGWIGCFYIGSCEIEKIVIENGVAK